MARAGRMRLRVMVCTVFARYELERVVPTIINDSGSFLLMNNLMGDLHFGA